jgi:hypothetical protein
MSHTAGSWKGDPTGTWETWTRKSVQHLVPGDRHHVRTSEGIGLNLLVRDDGDLTVEHRARVPASLFVGLRATRRVPRGLGDAQ